MNGWIGSRVMESGYGQQTYRTFLKDSEIAAGGAAQLWLLLDEHENTIDDGFFPLYMGGSQVVTSVPATRHQNGFALNFADGHSELYHLLTAEVRNWHKPPHLPQLAKGPPNTDLEKLREVTTVPD